MKLFPKETNNHHPSSLSGNDTAAVIIDTVPALMSFIRAEMRRRRMPGLSIPQFRTLVFLYRHQDASLTHLAEHLGLKLPSTSKIVDALVERNLVIRKISRKDRRRIKLRLSSSGQSQMLRARRSTLEQLSKTMVRLSPEQQTRIAEALQDLRTLFAAGQRKQSQ
jgi:DNA-binding MarR family transcriptional regulator